MTERRSGARPSAIASIVAFASLASLLTWSCRGPVNREFGEPFDGRTARPLSEVLEAFQPAADGVQAVVSGRIGEVCRSAGCWLVLQDVDEGKMYELFTDLRAGADFTIPRDASGRHCVVKGTIVGEAPDLKLNAVGVIVGGP